MNAPSRRAVSGILLLDKPLGISSNHALQAARRLYNAARAGHAGTLDPLASGLLPILFGDATRYSDYLLGADKTYHAHLQLGVTTTTGDAEGEVVSQHAVHCTEEEIDAVLAPMIGEQQQIPPMHSAIKVSGRPLYQLARQGEVIERAPRRIHLYVVRRLGPIVDGRVWIEIGCSKGTYVRTVAEEIGRALGCGAHLAGLRRTHTGKLRIEDALDLAALGALDVAARDARLISADRVLEAFPALMLSKAVGRRVLQGQTTSAPPGVSDGVVRAYAEGLFLGLVRVARGGLWPERLMPDTVFAPQAADNATETLPATGKTG